MVVHQVLASFKHRKSLLIKRLFLLAGCLLLVYIISTSSRAATSRGPRSNDESNERSAKDLSPYHWVGSRRKKALDKIERSDGLVGNLKSFVYRSWRKIGDEESKLLLNWERAPMAEKCRYLIDATYAVNEGWSNSMILNFFNNDETDNLLASLLGERLRLFDYCFISGKLPMRQVFEMNSLIDPKNISGSSPEDYTKRVFPFLNHTSDLLWPDITNLRTGEIVPVPVLPPHFNENFWLNWQSMAAGKGIVVTLNEASKSLFFKQLKVLEHNKNRLPIQIVTAGNEFSETFLTELKDNVRRSNQQVFLVDCSPILDTSFAKNNIVNVIHKWLAVIFNTFAEAVLLDVDAVPFVPIEDFLSNEKYKESGILMYKDRFMPTEHTFQFCIDMLKDVEPSVQEKTLIKSEIRYHSGTKHFDKSEEAVVYQRFFQALNLHHVDSGLVVINKIKNLNGLLFSFMLNLDAKMKRCVYGDKELFWLGQLFAGQDYTIYPSDGAIVGPVTELVEENHSSYQICAAQIAHSDTSRNLLWTNGGLKTCKLSGAAEKDFLNNPEYFKQRYQDTATLQMIYDAPLRVEGIIIPNTKDQWIQLLECSKYVYCASAFDKHSTSADQLSTVSHISFFDESTIRKYNSVISIWNQS